MERLLNDVGLVRLIISWRFWFWHLEISPSYLFWVIWVFVMYYILHIWHICVIPTYGVYQLYDKAYSHYTSCTDTVHLSFVVWKFSYHHHRDRGPYRWLVLAQGGLVNCNANWPASCSPCSIWKQEQLSVFSPGILRHIAPICLPRRSIGRNSFWLCPFCAYAWVRNAEW